MQIKIVLKGNKSNNRSPTVMIRINSELLYNETIDATTEIVLDVVANSSNVLEIEHYGKLNRDTVVDADGKIVSDLSVELVSIEIDHIQVLQTVLYNMPFYVNWPENIVADYQQRGELPPEYITNNLYFGFNGTYKLDFTNDVAVEYYRQFWLDECQAHANQTLVFNDSEVFNRSGETVAVNQDGNFTIYDLERVVLADKQSQ